MTITIRNQRRVVAKDGDECYGLTLFPTNRRVVIRMSQRLNRTIAEYGATLLHELLHVWVHSLTILGWKSIYNGDSAAEDEAEESFVLAAERVVLREFKHRFKRRK